jgi:3-oxoadipate enol-lactonase
MTGLDAAGVQRRVYTTVSSELEVWRRDSLRDLPVVCAAHPADGFDAGTVNLLAEVAESSVVCVNPPGVGGSRLVPHGLQPTLEQMVDAIETVRQRLGLGPWVFWGMSGGGWLAQLYARRHPRALLGIIVESVCLCFRERLADRDCALSPFFPAWRGQLEALGLIDTNSHAFDVTADAAEWIDVAGVGQVLRRPGGAALLVSPVPLGEGMLRALPSLVAFDARAWLGTVRTPALVIAGGADPVVPVSHVQRVHNALAGSRFLVADGAGHVPSAARDPRAISAVRAFLESLSGRAAPT